jgi:hypothetical protein
MEDKQKKFVFDMDRQCAEHDDWLVLVRFGMPTLLKDQEVLLELIYREARRQSERDKVDVFRPAEYMQKLFEELGLHIAQGS